MLIQFLLFVSAICLVAIFWELSKINSRLKKTLPTAKEKELGVATVKKDPAVRYEAQSQTQV